jgi:GxxExxY protein
VALSCEDVIIDAAIRIAIEVHRELGPGMLESAYQRIIRDELRDVGFVLETERRVPVTYKGRQYDHSFRADMVVNGLVVIEVKATERPAKVHTSQLLTYLRGLGLRHGLLLNFGMERAIDGVHRITNYRVPELPASS